MNTDGGTMITQVLEILDKLDGLSPDAELDDRDNPVTLTLTIPVGTVDIEALTLQLSETILLLRSIKV